MKKTHILLLIIVAGCTGVAFLALNNTETYSTFAEASVRPDKMFHVAGNLSKDKEILYAPQVDANKVIFYMTDNDNPPREHMVVLYKEKPQDMERSEQIVVVGKMEDSVFHAKDILTKCPSKYADAPTQEVN